MSLPTTLRHFNIKGSSVVYCIFEMGWSDLALKLWA